MGKGEFLGEFEQMVILAVLRSHLKRRSRGVCLRTGRRKFDPDQL